MAEFVARDGCRIGYDLSGRGVPLLLIPGLGGAASFWSGVARALSDRYQVIAVDHRGAGRSDRPDGRYTIEAIADDTAAILASLGIETAHVVGHSTGGVIAQTLALDRPGLVAGLVLSGTWDRPDAHFQQLFRARLAVLEQAGPQTYQRLTHALGYPAGFLEREGAALEAMVEGAARNLAPLPVTIDRIRMLLEHDRSGETGRIAAPTLVIGASDDAIIPIGHSRRLSVTIPGARLEVTEGAHFFPRVAPDWFARTIDAFLKEIPCPPPA